MVLEIDALVLEAELKLAAFDPPIKVESFEAVFEPLTTAQSKSRIEPS